jgi:hypothetical protein
MRTVKIVEIVLLVVFFMYMSLVTYVGFQEASWKERCKNAGGFPAASVCVNPGAVIEVN